MEGKNIAILVMALVILAGAGFMVDNHFDEKKAEEQTAAYQVGVQQCIMSIAQTVANTGYIQLQVPVMDENNETSTVVMTLVPMPQETQNAQSGNQTQEEGQPRS